MMSEVDMTYNWCHGPDCHKRHTTTRVRGVKGHKVLRTVKIALGHGYRQSAWQYFCDQTCMHDFIHKHIEEFVRIHPMTEPLETPIDVDWEKDPSNLSEKSFKQYEKAKKIKYRW